MAHIYPSLISSDLLNLQKTIELLDPHVPGYHLDVMDYHFVPNLTWGPAFLTAIASRTQKKLWVHLMVDAPEVWIDALDLPPQTIMTIHIETTNSADRLINLIQNKNWLPSIAISPKTPVDEIFPFLQLAHQALIMSVEPGHSGQQFMPSMMSKVDRLVEYRKEHNLNFAIGIDGGITQENICMVVDRGVDDLGVANAIFGQPDPTQAIQDLKKLIE